MTLTADKANIYILPNAPAWARLQDMAAQPMEPGSIDEVAYLKGQIGELGATYLASPAERSARMTEMATAINAAGHMQGLHGPFLSLLAQAEPAGDTSILSAGSQLWQNIGPIKPPIPARSGIPVLDADGNVAMVDPATLLRSMQSGQPGPMGAGGIASLLNEIDNRINKAFDKPEPGPAAHGVSNLVKEMNEAAVSLAEYSAIGLIIPGGNSIAAVLLVVSGVVAVGAAVVTLVGDLIDLIRGTEPTSVDLPSPTAVANAAEGQDGGQSVLAQTEPEPPESPDPPAPPEPAPPAPPDTPDPPAPPYPPDPPTPPDAPDPPAPPNSPDPPAPPDSPDPPAPPDPPEPPDLPDPPAPPDPPEPPDSPDPPEPPDPPDPAPPDERFAPPEEP